MSGIGNKDLFILTTYTYTEKNEFKNFHIDLFFVIKISTFSLIFIS